MKRSVFALVGFATLVAIAAGWNEAGACGDKFLVAGRGVRNQRAMAPPKPANILIYMNEGSSLPSVVKDGDLQQTLGMAGHKDRIVRSAAELEIALNSEEFDVVLTDLADAAPVQAKIKASKSKPVVLPVVYNASSEQVRAAKQQCGAVVKAPARSSYILAAIDEAVSDKEKAEKIAKKH